MSRPALNTEIGWEYLNAQQRKFAEEWVRTHNHTKALEHAEYLFDPKNPARDGHRLIKRCHRYIKYLEAKALRETFISIEAIQHQYVRLGFSNILNYYTRDAKTGKKRAKLLEELSHDEAAALKEVSFVTIKNDDGTETVVLGEIKLHDALTALRDLGKTIGAFPQHPALPPPPGGADAGGNTGVDFSRLPPKELRELDALMKKAIALMGSARDAQAITVPGAGAGQREERPASQSSVPRLPSGSTSKDS